MLKHAKELGAGFQFEPQDQANIWLIGALLDKGKAFLRKGELDEAIAAFKRAQTFNTNAGEIIVFTNHWNALCWHGSLAGQAGKVLEYCETAVKLSETQSNDTTMNERTETHDRRGLARALTGDLKGAIADFQFFVQHTDSQEEKKQRQNWIKELKKGKNPITEEVLRSLSEP